MRPWMEGPTRDARIVPLSPLQRTVQRVGKTSTPHWGDATTIGQEDLIFPAARSRTRRRAGRWQPSRRNPTVREVVRPFTDIVTTEAQLREVMGGPGTVAVGKQLNRLDRYCRDFVALSPFVLVGTFDSEGRCDVSPRGDAPGFVAVLDDKTLAVPERPGNRRLDSLINILETGSIGLLFLVPGFEETLRVNGRARVVRDADVLERTASHGKRPLAAIGVEVEECFLHCAKAFKRSALWRTDGWPERSALPSLGRMLREQGAAPGVSVEELEGRIEDDAKRLY